MASKHLVSRPAGDDQPQTWYCGYTLGLRGGKWPEEWTDDKTKATPLTQKQAKRLIDSQRHQKNDCNADPSFTIVY